MKKDSSIVKLAIVAVIVLVIGIVVWSVTTKDDSTGVSTNKVTAEDCDEGFEFDEGIGDCISTEDISQDTDTDVDTETGLSEAVDVSDNDVALIAKSLGTQENAITVNQFEGNYALINYDNSVHYLKKKSGIWVVIFSGQDLLAENEKDLADENFPTSWY